MRKISFLLIILAVFIMGCKGEEKTYSSPTLSEEWTIKMTQSGGIMGLRRSIQVASDGSYLIVDERAQTSVTGTLPEQQLSELKDLTNNLKFTSPENRAVCADCFVYDIEIESGGKKMILQVEDISLPDSGVEALVTFLRGILESA
ncbi:MAG: protealysin inhibitor emfourin [Anaerolineales bacterium]